MIIKPGPIFIVKSNLEPTVLVIAQKQPAPILPEAAITGKAVAIAEQRIHQPAVPQQKKAEPVNAGFQVEADAGSINISQLCYKRKTT